MREMHRIGRGEKHRVCCVRCGAALCAVYADDSPLETWLTCHQCDARLIVRRSKHSIGYVDVSCSYWVWVGA